MLHFFFFSKDLENFLRNSIRKSELKKGHTYGHESIEERRSKLSDQHDPKHDSWTILSNLTSPLALCLIEYTFYARTIGLY